MGSIGSRHGEMKVIMPSKNDITYCIRPHSPFRKHQTTDLDKDYNNSDVELEVQVNNYHSKDKKAKVTAYIERNGKKIRWALCPKENF